MKRLITALCALAVTTTGVAAYGYSAMPTPTITARYYCTHISNHRCWFAGGPNSNWTCWSIQHSQPIIHGFINGMHASSLPSITAGGWWNYNGYNYQIWQLKQSWCLDHWANVSCSQMTSRVRATCSNNL